MKRCSGTTNAGLPGSGFVTDVYAISSGPAPAAACTALPCSVALADDVGRDKQDPVGARERGAQGGRVGVVGAPHLGAERGQIGDDHRGDG